MIGVEFAPGTPRYLFLLFQITSTRMTKNPKRKTRKSMYPVLFIRSSNWKLTAPILSTIHHRLPARDVVSHLPSTHQHRGSLWPSVFHPYFFLLSFRHQRISI